jgi:hypothetical protein
VKVLFYTERLIADGCSRYTAHKPVILHAGKMGGTTCLLKLVPLPGTGFFIFIFLVAGITVNSSGFISIHNEKEELPCQKL